MVEVTHAIQVRTQEVSVIQFTGPFTDFKLCWTALWSSVLLVRSSACFIGGFLPLQIRFIVNKGADDENVYMKLFICFWLSVSYVETRQKYRGINIYN